MIDFFTSPKFYLPIVYIFLAFFLYIIVSKIVDKSLSFNKLNLKKSELQIKREKTIIVLIKNIIKYVIAVICILAILSIYGVKTTSIIASLGIAGAVIGLAFQDTIKSFLAGINIIFDNHYMQGDIVNIDGFKGEVLEIGLQTTKVKAYSGEVLIISNSSISKVINYSMYDTKLILELPISDEVSIGKIEDIINRIAPKIENMKEVKGKINLLGIEKLNSNNYIYKIELDCKANNQYGVNRAFMKYLKEEYEKEKINVPNDRLEIIKSNIK